MATFLVTSCKCQRSISVLKLIKTLLRSTITQDDVPQLADFAPCLLAQSAIAHVQQILLAGLPIRVCEDDWVPSLHATVVGVRRVIKLVEAQPR